ARRGRARRDVGARAGVRRRDARRPRCGGIAGGDACTGTGRAGARMIAAFEPFGITLLDPWFLAAIPAAAAAVVWRAVRPRAALPTAAVALFATAPRTLRQRLAWLPLALMALAAGCLATALARPVER